MADTEWKNKYFTALKSLEEDERRARDTETALRKVIARLCIAGRGQNETLDQQLTELADANKRNQDAQHLARLVSNIRDVVVETDRGTRHAKSGGVAAERRPASDPAFWMASCDAAALVLKQLARDEHTRDMADTLIIELRNAASDEALAEVLNKIADALKKRSEELARERQLANSLLTDMASRLDEVTQFLASQSEDRQAAFGDADRLNNQVMLQVNSLKSEAVAVDDIARLRAVVGQRLSNIEKEAREYRAREESRFLEQSAQTQKMAGRVAELERQASELHRSLQQELTKKSLDPLTGIPTRATFDERLAEEIRRYQRQRSPVAVLVWDLDRFKSINDTYGHRAGDRVLQDVANCFAGRLRATDVFARFGGEEFVMLLIGTSPKDAEHVANKLRKAVAELPFQFREKALQVTISCGITELRDGDTAESVFDRADAALYKAKGGGRNLCVAA